MDTSFKFNFNVLSKDLHDNYFTNYVYFYDNYAYAINNTIIFKIPITNVFVFDYNEDENAIQQLHKTRIKIETMMSLYNEKERFILTTLQQPNSTNSNDDNSNDKLFFKSKYSNRLYELQPFEFSNIEENFVPDFTNLCNNGKHITYEDLPNIKDYNLTSYFLNTMYTLTQFLKYNTIGKYSESYVCDNDYIITQQGKTLFGYSIKEILNNTPILHYYIINVKR